MNITEHIMSAWRSLSVSKMRTFLTILGIIVGISSVILINTVGGTIGKTISSTMNSVTSGDQFLVMAIPEEMDDTYFMSSEGIFDQELIEQFLTETEGKAYYIDEKMWFSGTMYDDIEKKADIQMVCDSDKVLDYSSYKITEGRMFTEEEFNAGKAFAVIEQKTAEKCFGQESAVGQKVKVQPESFYNAPGTVTDKTLEFTVIGVFSETVGSSEALGEQPGMCLIPTTYWNNYYNITSYSSDQLIFAFAPDADKDRIMSAADKLFKKRADDSGYLYMAMTLSEQLEIIEQIIRVISLVISGIAAISLLVGGIGVMNIMLVSVTERTMEIGVRKAMGADNNSIRAQFLTEAVIISLLGSVIGIVTGLFLAKLAAIIVVKIAAGAGAGIVVDLGVPVTAIVASVVFSFIIGLVFGVYPADKAAKMEVVDALRYE